MALLKNLLGNSNKEREFGEEIRALLGEIRQERERFESLLRAAGTAQDRLAELSEPIAVVEGGVEEVASRIAAVDQRLQATEELAQRFDAVAERAHTIAAGQERAAESCAALEAETREIRATFTTLSEKVDLAVDLSGRLERFLDTEKPFSVLREEAGSVRGQVEGTNEQLGRLRDQNERLLVEHKSAVAKLEAIDRRREDFSRDLQDKERRVARIEEAVQELDGARGAAEGVRRELSTLQGLADGLAAKTSALEAQREAVDRALSQMSVLEQAMRQIDAGVRQQRENGKLLQGLQEGADLLRGTQEKVIDRAGEINEALRRTEDEAAALREELAGARADTQSAVDRFDFERNGLEAVTQRVGDLRSALSDFESRFQGARETGENVSQLAARVEGLATKLQGLHADTRKIEEDLGGLPVLRRGLAEVRAVATALGPQVTRLEEARPGLESALRDLERLHGTHALVRDTLEQAKGAHEEIARMRSNQSDLRDWMIEMEEALRQTRIGLNHVEELSPTLKVTEERTQRIQDALAAIENREAFVENLHRRLAEVGSLATMLDERGQQLLARMNAAEERFVRLAGHAEDADRTRHTIAEVTTRVTAAVQQVKEIGESVAAAGTRCQSIEELAEQSQSLRAELEQRQTALQEAARNLEQATVSRQEAATAAQELEELAQRLGKTLSAADRRAASANELASELEGRVAQLQAVDRRLSAFEERLVEWAAMDEEVGRSLEQIAARQGTVKTLHADLERMVGMAEKTTAEVRTILAAQAEIAESRGLLDDVQGRLQELQAATAGLEERKRQMAKAEERLARSEGLLADVRTQHEALQRQKALVEQAVEKAGSLRVLLKQSEAMIEGLREEREMVTRVGGRLALVPRATEDREVAGIDDQAA